MKPSGAHTHPDGGGGAAVLVILIVIVYALAHAVAHAVAGILTTVIVIIASAAGLGIVGAVALCFYVRRRHGDGAQYIGEAPVTHTRRVSGPSRAELEDRIRQLESGGGQHQHLHFHGLAADDIAAIITSREKQ
jgi:hypothetical protein